MFQRQQRPQPSASNSIRPVLASGWFGLCEEVNDAVDKLGERMRERLNFENAVYAIAKTGSDYVQLMQTARETLDQVQELAAQLAREEDDGVRISGEAEAENGDREVAQLHRPDSFDLSATPDASLASTQFVRARTRTVSDDIGVAAPLDQAAQAKRVEEKGDEREEEDRDVGVEQHGDRITTTCGCATSHFGSEDNTESDENLHQGKVESFVLRLPQEEKRAMGTMPPSSSSRIAGLPTSLFGNSRSSRSILSGEDESRKRRHSGEHQIAIPPASTTSTAQQCSYSSSSLSSTSVLSDTSALEMPQGYQLFDLRLSTTRRLVSSRSEASLWGKFIPASMGSTRDLGRIGDASTSWISIAGAGGRGVGDDFSHTTRSSSRAGQSTSMGTESAHARYAREFGLTPFERDKCLPSRGRVTRSRFMAGTTAGGA
ncbi:unnamed protein product [Amoebophrya sp. A25]|nr:unnamed protein product [Amoebophrya sp. A25]|eukprot:GSA25T00020739001.1